MGTSLSGLTPATTFDGLLKVGDNDPLTAELKAISTGDGTDTILQLSTTALQISGDTTIETTGTWVNGFNSNLRLESDAPSMQFKDTGGTPGFMIGVSGGSTIFYQSSSADFSSTNAVGRIFSGRWSFGVGTDLGASVGIKGSGASALTTSLLVQNSAGTQALKVTDDGELTLCDSGKGAKINLLRSIGGAQIGYIEGQSSGVMISMANNSNQILLSNNGIGIGETTPAARLHIKGSGNDNTTTSLLVQNSDGDDMLEVDDSGNVGIGSPNPLSATLHISSQSYFNNTTALRIQNSIGNNLFRIKGDGTTDILNSQYIFNKSGISTGGAIFKGSGATSATTALLVQNSAGALNLKVNDDGSVFSHGGGARTSSNTGFGEGVLASVTTATNTTAFGVSSLKSVTTATANTAYGWRSGYTTTGSNNAFVGMMAGYTNSSGANNTGLGTRVLYNNATASDNTAVGYLADSAGFSGSVILGRSATATADNQFVVGSSAINAGTITTEAVTSDATWEVVINGTAYKVLLKAV